MSRVSEHEATIAVEAAAKKVWEENAKGYNETMARQGLPSVLEWDDPRNNPLTKREYREAVLPIVWAALEALPDGRRSIWLEGYIAADNGRDESENPYPEEA